MLDRFDCKRGLKNIKGLIDLLNNLVLYKRKKFLGICVGMQLMVNYSSEKKRTLGFGWLSGNFKKIKKDGKDYLGREYKIPHMGWNNLQIENKIHPILENISEREQYYFVHSYFLESKQKDQIIANTNYNHKIPVIIGKENYVGVQFHPEKSGNSVKSLYITGSNGDHNFREMEWKRNLKNITLKLKYVRA